MDKNDVYVTTDLQDERLWSKQIRLTNVHWIDKAPDDKDKLMVRTRHRAKLVPVKLLNKLSNLRKAKGNDLPLLLHTDAAQAGNYLDLHVARLGVDMMSINGSKLYGPKQSGALYIRAGIDVTPLIVGGGQEFGLRSGTENVAFAAGLAKALEIAQSDRQQQSESITEFRQKLESELTGRFSLIAINGSKHRAPHICSMTFAGYDNERVMMQLDELGIICAVGSACSASSDTPSHVLSAIGLSDQQARSTLRFSLGRQTTEAEIDALIGALAEILK